MADWRWLATVAGGVGLASFGALYLLRRKGINSGSTFKRRNDPLSLYVTAHNVENPILAKLRKISVEHERGSMATSVEVGKVLITLCQLLNARKVLDIGVFTGCSAVSMALGLPDDGKVIACDVSEEYTSLGRPYWEEAGVADKIDLRIQPAVQTLQELLDNGEKETFDLVFIDADKVNYSTYYDMGIQLLRTGGLIIVDNALWSGRVADPTNQQESTVAIRALNETMKNDHRVNFTLLTVSDGIGIAQKL